jgi:hypothetical protein
VAPWIPSSLAAALAAALLFGAPQPAVGAAEAPPERSRPQLGETDVPGDWPPPPLGWREPSPVARLFLQLPFEAPEPIPTGHLQAGLQLLYSNSIMVGRTPGLTLVTDVETAQTTLLAAAGLGGGLEVSVALPVVADWGGLLDRPIEAVERGFGASNPDRLGRPIDRSEWTLLRDDGRGLSRVGAGAGLGDAWIGLKARLLEGAGAVPSLSARLALSLPTGRLPWGAGALVPAAGLLAGWRLAPFALRLSADVSVPTAPLRAVALPTRPYGSVNVGLTFPLGHALALQAQASAHSSPLHSTSLAQLDHATAYVLLGLTARIAPGAVVDVGIAENVFSPYRGTDVSFLVALRSQ